MISEKVNHPTVSVIVATYKRDKSLKTALESINTQTYPYIEIIVVDDNADINWNNKVQEIIKEIKLKYPIRYIQNQVNKGSAETRNIGIRSTSGEYITFLDDDDIYLPNKVGRQIEHMLYNKSDYSITDLYFYDENDRLIEKRNRKYIQDNDMDSLLRYHLMYHMTGTDTLMFKREYLLGIGGFPPIDVGDEFYLMQKAIDARGKFSYLPANDIKAYVHTETDGLSSGESKIKGENALYEHKKNYFHRLNKKDIRYIKMRHFAVLAFAEFRRKRYFNMIQYLCLSFISSPTKLINLYINRK